MIVADWCEISFLIILLLCDFESEEGPELFEWMVVGVAAGWVKILLRSIFILVIMALSSFISNVAVPIIYTFFIWVISWRHVISQFIEFRCPITIFLHLFVKQFFAIFLVTRLIPTLPQNSQNLLCIDRCGGHLEAIVVAFIILRHQILPDLIRLSHTIKRVKYGKPVQHVYGWEDEESVLVHNQHIVEVLYSAIIRGSNLKNKSDEGFENCVQKVDYNETYNLDDELCLDELEEHNTIVGEENPNISSFHIRLMAGVVPHLRIDVDNN